MTSGNFQLSNQLMFCTHVLELFDLLRENFFQNSEVRIQKVFIIQFVFWKVPGNPTFYTKIENKVIQYCNVLLIFLCILMLFEIFTVLPQAHLLEHNRDFRRIPLSLKRSHLRNINIIYNHCIHTIRSSLMYFVVWIPGENTEFSKRIRGISIKIKIAPYSNFRSSSKKCKKIQHIFYSGLLASANRIIFNFKILDFIFIFFRFLRIVKKFLKTLTFSIGSLKVTKLSKF